MEHGSQWITDPQTARITELEEAGDLHIARRVAACGQIILTKHQQLAIAAPCHRRECPRCSDELYWRYRGRVLDVARLMSHPYSVRLSLPSHGERDLEQTLRRFREALRALRRLRCMAGVKLGVGMIHPGRAHGENGERWNVHAHLLLDVPPDFDINKVEVAWDRATKGEGYLEPRPVDHPGAEPGDPGDELERFAGYVAHSRDWSPSPENGGWLSPESASILWRAMQGKQLIISWGADGRGRRREELREAREAWEDGHALVGRPSPPEWKPHERVIVIAALVMHGAQDVRRALRTLARRWERLTRRWPDLPHIHPTVRVWRRNWGPTFAETLRLWRAVDAGEFDPIAARKHPKIGW